MGQELHGVSFRRAEPPAGLDGVETCYRVVRGGAVVGLVWFDPRLGRLLPAWRGEGAEGAWVAAPPPGQPATMPRRSRRAAVAVLLARLDSPWTQLPLE